MFKFRLLLFIPNIYSIFLIIQLNSIIIYDKFSLHTNYNIRQVFFTIIYLKEFVLAVVDGKSYLIYLLNKLFTLIYFVFSS
jgi:hypothetical protein